ncbi:periplasmic sensor diguanylate cyclase/phosphodiesterase [Shewanella denitrificans OS217]|jgi:diguanylate cyclase (GGDEF)-like protein|uniref:Periplasmic sensor diguanylate cyclase/phosphodiesterase n=1 Tax=Shewanella denitrificans (strain OS217 / ATCC BAA-1090 / DSM 15013) TaxID=318161 RepID=Q12RR4_SHEDO|nr:EAL domain-containing protein [Shewanella denitrificans]ABE53862.1 periplasmic sensor diguanylate cyclase/phosphodiesterase [Shewanella denitrificans OS217]
MQKELPLKTAPVQRDSLGRWILNCMAAVLLTVSAFFLWGAHSLVDSRFDNFDASVYEQQLLRVSGIFEQNRLSFELQVNDYARWDHTEAFVLNQQPAYIEENLFPTSLANIQVDGFIFTRLDGSLVTPPLLRVGAELTPMPDPMWEAISQQLPSLIKNDKSTAHTRFVWFEDEVIMVSGTHITDTAQANAPSGYLFFIRHLDEARLGALRELTGVNFRLAQTTSMDTVETQFTYKRHKSHPHWLTSMNLTGLPALIQVQGSTHLQAERQLTFTLLAFSVAGLSIVALFGIYWLIHLKVIRRLELFSKLADKNRQTRAQSIRWPVSGSDELDNLASSMNDFITEVEVRHKELNYLANHDPLTGIGNRRLLMASLDDKMELLKSNPKFTCNLLLLDIDQFKLFNDGLGHAAGDEILCLIAKRLSTKVKDSDTLVRLGGDAFAILQENVSLASTQDFATDLLQHLAVPFVYQEHQLNLRASIGFAQVKLKLSKEDVIRNADLAMYEAKRRGKNQVAIFTVNLLDTVSRRMHLEQALREALNQQSLEVWFQPIIDARYGKIVGMEALSRWSLEGEYIPADEFISIAEASGMVAQLGKQVLDKVGAVLQELRLQYPALECNVNLSVQQFRDPQLISDIVACRVKYQLPASALHLELTESMIAQSESEILPIMRALVNQGFKFHLDDFGTGYSSLERLKHLPFDTLKIDRSFITPLSLGDDVMVRNIINIGHELGMNLIAEGVENERELEHLLQLGCNQIQGYYFARPMPYHALKIWLKEHQD